MKATKFIRMGILTALVTAALTGAPTEAQAASGGTRGETTLGDVVIVKNLDSTTFGEEGADELVDGGSTENPEANSTSISDPEYKYVPVRR